MNPLLRILFARKTGLKDINGSAIRNHDAVTLYPAVFPKVKVGEFVSEDGMSGADVYQLDVSGAPGFVDQPLARGRVLWDVDGLRWAVRFFWVCDSWALSGIASCGLGGHGYAFELCSDTLEAS